MCLPKRLLMGADVVLTTFKILEVEYRKATALAKMPCSVCGKKYYPDKYRLHRSACVTEWCCVVCVRESSSMSVLGLLITIAIVCSMSTIPSGLSTPQEVLLRR